MKTQLQKTLVLSCFLATVSCIFANAQIVYTDVNPDRTFSIGDTLNLDLNNDGIVDFTIVQKDETSIPKCSTSSTSSVIITPAQNDEVAEGYKDKPDALLINNLIEATSTWNSAASQILAKGTVTCSFDPCSCYPGNPIGNWNGIADKYLGLTINVGGNEYYGWARLDVSVQVWTTQPSLTLKDYAYNSIPDQSILAGDTGKIITGIHNIKGFSSIIVSPNAFQQLTHISFSLPQTEIVSIQIYNVQGRLIRTLADQVFSQGENQLQWNATDANGNAVSAGIYLLKIQSPGFSQTEKLMVVK